MKTSNFLLNCTHFNSTILFHSVDLSLYIESLHFPITGEVFKAANIEATIVFYKWRNDSPRSLFRSIDCVAFSRNAADGLLAKLAGGGLVWPPAVEVAVDIVTSIRAKIHSNVIVSRENCH